MIHEQCHMILIIVQQTIASQAPNFTCCLERPCLHLPYRKMVEQVCSRTSDNIVYCKLSERNMAAAS